MQQHRAKCHATGASILLAGLLLFSLSGWAESVGEQARGKIKHVVIIVQENRTFDNIFGGDARNLIKPHSMIAPSFTPCPARPFPFPGAESVYPAETGKKMTCQQFGGPGHINGSHDVWQCLKDFKSPFSSAAWFNVVSSHPVCDGVTFKSFGTGPFSYLANDLRRTYWDIAQKYVLGDKFFAVTSTSSFPGHQYIVAAQSVEPTTKSIVADQPRLQGDGQGNGCIDGKDASLRVPVLQTNNYIGWENFGLKGECYPNKTLADLMDEKPISWTHFVTSEYTGSGFVKSGVFDGFINIVKWYHQTGDWPTSISDLKQRMGEGALPAVTLIKPPCMALSDHPGGVSTNNSAYWVGSVVNWIGESKANLWNDTVIFVVWDDWGGFYDHVAPPKTRSDRLGPGLRIPFLVISPYGRNGTVVHTEADYGSVLKFVEDLFGLGTLTNVDKDAPDLVGFFDFSRKRPFVPVVVKVPFNQSMCEVISDKKLIDP